jgi:arsenite methyltransferase
VKASYGFDAPTMMLALVLGGLATEGVEGRVTLETGDTTKMPFHDASFDAIVSSWAIHNVPTAEGRTLSVTATRSR